MVNLRWSKSVSLVAFFLVAVLIASGVGANVLAQTGGGAVGTTVSRSNVLDPTAQLSVPPGQVAPPCSPL
ncbi:MAG: hypothetical protein Q7R34_11920, partial [Dehalococcoidia bacterium]|nr:hypothetical protein [Dehalococcoidia bacterium]